MCNKPIVSSFENNVEGPDGPLVTQAYVCPQSGNQYELQSITLPSLSPTMIEIEIQMCGLCHTDIHMRDNDWGTADFPLVAGHEGVGIVRKIGSGVRLFSVGDRAGLPWIRDSCRSCDNCLSGFENLCQKGYQGLFLGKHSGIWGDSPLEYNKHGGAFSKVQRIEERFAVAIPEIIPTFVACPLMCAGSTVFEPLAEHCKPGNRVGIVGIGALGTLALKLGKLFALNMVAISSSSKKREAMKSLGVHGYTDMSDEQSIKEMSGKLDVIIDTTPVNDRLGEYMGLLKMGGTFVKVGIPAASAASFSENFISLVFTGKKIAGSIVIGSKRMKQMMNMVADNFDDMKDNDLWRVEVIPFTEMADAIDKIKNRTNTCYKYVLKW